VSGCTEFDVILLCQTGMFVLLHFSISASVNYCTAESLILGMVCNKL
jgi:hypothetical protein